MRYCGACGEPIFPEDAPHDTTCPARDEDPMTVNDLRAQMPGGTDVRIKLRTRSKPLPLATVVEHDLHGVYVGVHPDLLYVPYADIEEIR